LDSHTFDIETDGLLNEMTHVKCLNVINTETGEKRRFTDAEFYQDAVTGETTKVRTPRDGTLKDGIALLMTADEVAGQNIVGFDLPALAKLHGANFPAIPFDTMVVSQMLFPDLGTRDKAARLKGKMRDMPGNLIGTHKLAAWGYRLGTELKGEFKPSAYSETWSWSNYPFSRECDDYCAQDVVVNVGLVTHLKKRCEELAVPEAALRLEHEVAAIVARQSDYGWKFDVKAAEALTVELMKEKIDHETKLVARFGEFFLRDGKDVVPKKSRKSKAEAIDGAPRLYLANAAYSKIKLTQFNPSSRAHIAMMLARRYQWEATEFTPNGQPKIDEAVLGQLPYPEAQALSEYFRITKMLGQVSEGKGAFLKAVKADGRIHGRVNTCGAVTARMTHSSPNIAQADTDKRVRGLFIASDGFVLVGTDADAIELRCLAHFLAKYDNGAYIETVLRGKKEDGTDMHTRNMKATSLTQRECAKRIFYAWLYGAGDYKLGLIVYESDFDDAKRKRFNERFQGDARKAALSRIGRRIRDGLVAGIDGADKLIELCKHRAKTRGYVLGLDGRRVPCRSQHAALNTLLQSAGALAMKKALVIAQEQIDKLGLVHGVDYAWVGNIHDELQMEAKEEHAESLGRICAAAIRDAGEHFKFRCPLAGNFSIGATWADTH
jgi:DNA polymerase-1